MRRLVKSRSVAPDVAEPEIIAEEEEDDGGGPSRKTGKRLFQDRKAECPPYKSATARKL